MRNLKALLTIAAGLWTVGVVVGAVKEWLKGDMDLTGGFASIGAIAACAVITAWLYQWTVKKPANNDTTISSEEPNSIE